MENVTDDFRQDQTITKTVPGTILAAQRQDKQTLVLVLRDIPFLDDGQFYEYELLHYTDLKVCIRRELYTETAMEGYRWAPEQGNLFQFFEVVDKQC